MSIPSRDVLADVVNRFVTAHTEWDSLHQFVTLHWDGEKITPGTLVAIDPSIDPRAYPQLMTKTVLESINNQQGVGERSLYAFLLQFEGHAVRALGEEATEQEQQQFQHDRLGRTFHQRADAVEVCSAYCIDIHRRLWTAVKRRPTPDKIEQHFHADPSGAPSGGFVRALRAVATLTGTALHGLPVPVGGVS